MLPTSLVHPHRLLNDGDPTNIQVAMHLTGPALLTGRSRPGIITTIAAATATAAVTAARVTTHPAAIDQGHQSRFIVTSITDTAGVEVAVRSGHMSAVTVTTRMMPDRIAGHLPMVTRVTPPTQLVNTAVHLIIGIDCISRTSRTIPMVRRPW